MRRLALPHDRLVVAGLLVTVSIWGTTFVATKAALRELPPFTLTLLRFALASAALWPLARRERRWRRSPLPWRQLALAGFLGGFVFFALQNLGLVYTTAAKASLIMAATPAVIAGLSTAVLHERIGAARWAGVAASVAGVAVIVAADPAATWQGGQLLGDLLMVATGLSWAAYTILGKGLEARVAPAVVSLATVGLGGVFLLPFVAYELLRQPPAWPTAATWLAVAYLGVVASTLPFLLWNWALKHLDASEAAAYVNLVPLVAVASAALLLGERLALPQCAGGGLVLAGVWLSGRGR